MKRRMARALVGIALVAMLNACQRQSSVQNNASSSVPAQSGSILRKVGTMELPGPAGQRFDYLAYDPDDHYILSAHLGAGLMYVIDPKANVLVGTVTDVPGIEGITYVGDGKKAYTSDWYENKVAVVDMQQRKVVKKLPTEAKPDGSTYAAPFHKLYISNELGKSETVIDTTKDEVVTTIRFDSETGVPYYDPVSRKVFVNLQDDGILAAIDPATDTVTNRYETGNCVGNHGMAIDSEHRRLFIACEANNQLMVFNLDTMKPMASFPLAGGVDVVQFDSGLGRIYAACYSGTITVIQEDDADHFRKLEDVPTQPRVHSLGIDPVSHRVYVPEEQENGKSVSRMIVYDTQ